MKGTETDTVRAILQYLHLKGILAWRMNSRVVMLPGKGGKDTPYRMGGVKGMADIIGCVPPIRPAAGSFGLSRDWPYVAGGHFLAIEVKSKDGKPTPEQSAFLAAVNRAGGIAFIARSVKDVQEHGL